MTDDRSWMRPVLTALFDWLSVEETLACIRDETGRQELRTRLADEALADGRFGTIPSGQYGDNLLQGLLALRSKFDRETAARKLELNVSMRARRG
jgi:hypothetical protein